MAKDGEHFSRVFWPFGFLPLKNLFTSVVRFFIGSLLLGEFSFMSSLYTLVVSPLMCS
jgi:hypothetical protein